MVAYGDALRLCRRPGWEEAYVDYENLQMALRTALGVVKSSSSSSSSSSSLPPFEVLLEREIEKVSFFALYQQGEIAQQIGSLRFLQLGRPWFRVAVDPREASVLGYRENRSTNTTSWLDVRTSTTSKRTLHLDEEESDDENDDHDHEDVDEESALLSPNKRSSSIPLDYETRPIFPAMAMPLSSHNNSKSNQEQHPRPSATSSPPPLELVQAFTHWGVELLHIQRYVCINTMGIRKIVNKYHKRQQRKRRSVEDFNNNNNKESDENNLTTTTITAFPATRSHGKQLASMGASIDALYETLTMACATLQPSQVIVDGDDYDDYYYSWIRLHCTLALIQVMRDFANHMNETFVAFLSNKAMIIDLQHQGDRQSREALTMVLRCQPDILKEMTPSQLDAWYIEEQKANGLLETMRGGGRGEGGSDDDFYHQSWGGVDSISLALNLLSTLLYTVNYYIVAPTANRYAILLGVDGAFGATLVGASSLAALGAAFLYSAWYTRFSFRSALIFSAVCPCIGNLLYAIAISYRSLPIALWGRILVGLGSAEVVNRQLIAACVSFQHLTPASAYFVAAGAVGMSVGPLLAALLDMFAGRDTNIDLSLMMMPEGGIIYNHVTSPGFVTAGMWFLQGVALILFFKEPTRIHTEQPNDNPRENSDDKDPSAAVSSRYSTFDKRTKATLESVGIQVHSTIRTVKLPEEKPLSLWIKFGREVNLMEKLIFGNVALPITLFLFGFIELVDEVLISSCAMVCKIYFDWYGSTAGFILASLGALVLPAHFVVEKAAHHYEERTIIKYSILFICLGLFGILNYEGIIFDGMGLAADIVGDTTNSTDHVEIAIGGQDILHFLNHEQEVPYDWGGGQSVYLLFLSAIFMGTIILEGVDTSVMAKATPPALNDTFINSGLLATLVGTVGRVVGDSMITFSVFVDKDVFTDFVNAAFSPIIPLSLVGYYLVKRNYNELLEK